MMISEEWSWNCVMASDFFTKFVSVNEPTSRFLYGLVFFVSGIGILVQYQHENSYSFSKELWLLGLFAFMHGLLEWLDMFIPLQASYLNPEVIFHMMAILMVFAALAFVALFTFGLRLIFPGRAILYDIIPYFFFIPWLVIWIIVIVQAKPNAITFIGDISRYMLYTPASIATALGLYLQVHNSRQTPYFVEIKRTILILSFAFIFYGVFSGVMIGPEPFFPASVINSERFYTLTHVSIKFFRALCGTLVMVYTLKLLFELNKEAAHILMEARQETLRLAERERIAQDLHDGVIQTLYATGLMLESCLRQIKPKSPLSTQLKASMTSLNTSMIDLRQYITGLENESITCSTLETALSDLIKEFERTYQISVSYLYEVDHGLRLSSSRQKHLYHVFKELFNNVAKHANASHVEIYIQQEDETLLMTFFDDGKGFPYGPLKNFNHQYGMGLRHIHERISALQGKIVFSRPEQGGTQVKMEIPKEVDYGDSIVIGR